MRTQDIIIGEYYRHKDTPNYAWAKPTRMLPPRHGENKNGYAVFECEWTVNKGESFGMIKYFRASNLVKPS